MNCKIMNRKVLKRYNNLLVTTDGSNFLIIAAKKLISSIDAHELSKAIVSIYKGTLTKSSFEKNAKNNSFFISHNDAFRKI